MPPSPSPAASASNAIGQAGTGVTIIVGAQWGDEGKGKWIDILAGTADLAVRYQGGNNAGHTLWIDGVKTVLHQLPSSIFHPRQTAALAAGVVVNPVQLVAEIAKVADRAALTPERLWLSARAHIISPWHIHLDEQRESSAARPIGTTKRGIGPTYAEKAARTGLRLGDYVHQAAREQWTARMAETAPGFRAHMDADRDAWAAFEAAAAPLLPFVCDAESRIRAAVKAGKKVLLEGAQGAMLDIDHGTYPFVTSSSTSSGGACQSIGMSPKTVGLVIGIAKAYVTRVGAGPMPTELSDAVGAEIARRGNEFGATTGRPRRCGWLDAVALRYGADVNGFDGIVLNKMDILTGIGPVKIAVAYEHPRLGRLTELPWDLDVLGGCKPVYETFAGWDEPLPQSGRFADMPRAAREFVAAVERHVGTKVMMVGSGPGRENAIYP
jgi:adenylosuccinate synthase